MHNDELSSSLTDQIIGTLLIKAPVSFYEQFIKGFSELFTIKQLNKQRTATTHNNYFIFEVFDYYL